MCSKPDWAQVRICFTLAVCNQGKPALAAARLTVSAHHGTRSHPNSTPTRVWLDLAGSSATPR